MKTQGTITFIVKANTLFSVSFQQKDQDIRFYTSSALFDDKHEDPMICGQCQESVLPRMSKAMMFYKKWKGHQMRPLSEEEQEDLYRDMMQLKWLYRYNIGEGDQEEEEVSFIKVACGAA